MTRRMLIDATHPEETRVSVVNGTKLEEFDYETEFRKQLKGNIYLAKVTRVEPSLQAAFVEYGGNRHAFLPFPEIHSDYYRIPVGDRPHDEMADAEDEDDTVESLPEGALSEVRFSGGPLTMPLENESDPPDLVSEAFDRLRDEEPHSETEHEESFPAPEHDTVANMPETDAPAAEAAANAVEETHVETVGGDEVEEIRHRRRSVMPRYKIQEVIKRRQIMLIQVSKEERGNKGAAVTTFLSLPGRYCVLMPNTPRGGGVSRKIANPQDRKRLKDLIGDLELPDGMSVILRTAGVERTKTEIKRDLDYLMRLWETIRDLTLRSTAPALVYEEGNLIKRAIRDIYSREIDEIMVAGENGYKQAKDFMRMLMPSHARRVQLYHDPVPLFFRYQVETQIDAIHSPVAQLRSGGYIVMNQTEALVSIDVNSGRSTRERNIEETAYKTNLEAADEIARQLRLRDLGGLVVVDFIDMEDPRHDSAVERRLKEAMKNDRARIQIGRMSAFGLLELSRQRLHPSLLESNFHTCAACRGTGIVRSMESAAFVVLRAIEEEGIKGKAAEITFHVPGAIALYILNQKRPALASIEERYALKITLAADDTLISPDFRVDRVRPHPPGFVPPVMLQPMPPIDLGEELEDDIVDEAEADEDGGANAGHHDTAGGSEQDQMRRRRRRRGRRRGGSFGEQEGSGSLPPTEPGSIEIAADQPDFSYPAEAIEGAPAPQSDRPAGSRRRRGRRGGKRNEHHKPGTGDSLDMTEESESGDTVSGDNIYAFGSDYSDSPPAGGARDYTMTATGEPQQEYAQEYPGVAAPSIALTEDPSQESGENSHPIAEATAQKKEYETVNQTPETPKNGWWKRLIQEK